MLQTRILPPPKTPVPGPARSPSDCSWHEALRDAVRDPFELCRLLRLPRETAEAAARAVGEFPLFVPRDYLARMRPGDACDPLLRQVLPVVDELTSAAGFTRDPVDDRAATLTPGLLQKYRNRVLMVTTGACAVHCRYCFRRHFPYSKTPRTVAHWRSALDQIAADPTVHEVILSGGDPLMLVDDLLAQLVNELAAIPHLRRIRVHTRLPIMIPQRVTDELLAWLRGTRLAPIFVVHANHAAELDEAVAAALARLSDAGVPLLNQAVLLRGINDELSALRDLCERLIDLRVMPYYLHQLDRVAGASHFEVHENVGRQLIRELRALLPGYAIPRYVRETAGHTSKELIA